MDRTKLILLLLLCLAVPLYAKDNDSNFKDKPLNFRESPPNYSTQPANFRNTPPGYTASPPGFSANPPRFIEKEKHPQINNSPQVRIEINAHPSANKDEEMRLAKISEAKKVKPIAAIESKIEVESQEGKESFDGTDALNDDNAGKPGP